MEMSRRTMLEAGVAATGALLARSPAGAALPLVFTPEQFGAKGDGVTDDTAALARLADHVSARGGGAVNFRRAIYLVGSQARTTRQAPYAFEPARLLEFTGCTRPLILRGNGARLKCAPGLRYGTFDRASGRATRNQMPYTGSGELATPYRWMIKVQDCSGLVEISDFELDGNIANLRIGGPWGDTGHQINATGLALVNNRGPERLARIYSHHHGQDGLLIDGADFERRATSAIEQLRCEYNGRQGCSIVGGKGYDFRECRFNHTGRAGIASNPGAGVDIEAEAGKKVRRLRFSNCEFSNNHGQGLVADSGDSQGATFTGCTFVGTTNWAVWPHKPFFRFDACTFVGPIVHPFGSPDRAMATQFHGCTFRDDPALSPNGKVYGGENPDRPIADLPGNANVLFNRCRFRLTHDAVLPWSVDVIYADCVMSQSAARASFPRGTYVGRNIIKGHAIVASSPIRGELVLNGRSLGPARQ